MSASTQGTKEHISNNLVVTSNNLIINSSDKKPIKCVCMNARSIVNKLSEFEIFVLTEKPDILGVTETWLNSNISNNEINIEGYSLFRRDRNSLVKQRGGGISLWVRNELNPVCHYIEERGLVEILFCKIKNKGKEILLGVCYRPPDSGALHDQEMFNIIEREGNKNSLFLMGDFNYAELDWGDQDLIDRNHPFVECLDNNFLSQVVDKPSRGNNYLDLIMTTDNSVIGNVTVGEPFDGSDHKTISVELYFEVSKEEKKYPMYNYFKADYDVIRDYVTALGWEDLDRFDDVNTLWDKLKSDILSIRDKFIGLKSKPKNKCKWVTKKCTKLRKAKKSAWIAYQKSNRDEHLYENYKTKLRASVAENKKAKLNYEQTLADKIKVDCKSFYSYVSSKTRSHNRIGPLLDENNVTVVENKTLADLLNKYFCSVFTTENKNFTPTPELIYKGSKENMLLNTVIQETVVLDKLKQLNVNKSLGPDEISGKLLFEIRYELVKPLTKLFNLSIETGLVPQDWRDASVIPLFKSGNKEQCKNYRPISLTSIVGKILEGIIKDLVVSHLEHYKLLRDSQHGFINGRSCLTNLLDFFDTVTSEIDEGKNLDIIYLDFAKAFDKVCHGRLGKKLESHGVGGNVLQWIKGWLSKRRQKVFVEGEFSEWGEVISGVPQGSVLGPTLFLIYINDIDCNLISKLGKFADDSKLAKAVENQQDVDAIRLDLLSLEKWSEDWQMQFNADKCSVIHLGHSNPCNEYRLYEKAIKSSDAERDLGVIIDKSLKFSEQCNRVASTANATLGLIKRNIVSRNKDIITKLYKALVRPKLEYCVQAWRPFLKKDIEKLEKVQRRATKIINECRGLNYEDRLKITGLVTLEQRRDRGDMIEVYKILTGKNKTDYRKYFTLSNHKRTRGHVYKLSKNRSRLEIRKNFFSQRVVNKWNGLPDEVVNATSVNSFKNLYDKYYSTSM